MSGIHHISYNDLIKSFERRKVELEYRKDRAIHNGARSVEPISHDLECTNILIRLLKKFNRKARQGDLFEMFKEV